MKRRAADDGSQLGLLFDAAAAAVSEFFGGSPPAGAVEDDDLDGTDEQAAEDAEDAARAAELLLGTLKGMGLQHVRSLVLTRNRSVVVSLASVRH